MKLYLLVEMEEEFLDIFYDIDIQHHSLKEVHQLGLIQIVAGFWKNLFVLEFLFVVSYEAYELKQPVWELQTDFIKLKSQVELQSKQIKPL